MGHPRWGADRRSRAAARRGPFKSLTDARAAVEDAREGPIPESSLADRIKKAGSPKKGKAGSAEPKEPKKPAEPRWLTELSKSERERAQRLLAVLVGRGLSDAEEVVRDDLDRGSPALARLAISRAIEDIARTGDAPDAREVARDVASLLGSGRDAELGVSWRLVDGDGRPIDATGRELRAALKRAGRSES